MIFSATKRALQILPVKWRQKTGLLVAIQFANSVLEIFSLAAILPAVLIILNPDSSDRYFQPMFGFDAPSVVLLAAGLLAFIVLKVAIVVGLTRYRASFAFNAAADISSDRMKSLLSRDYTAFTSADFGQEQTRLASHPFAFANNIILPLTTIFSEVVMILMLMAALVYWNSTFAILGACLLALTIPLLLVRKKGLSSVNTSLRAMFPRLNSYALTAMDAFKEIKVFRKAAYFHDRFADTARNISNAFIREQTIHAVSSRMGEIFVVILIVLLLVISAASEVQREAITLLATISVAFFRLIPSISKITSSLQQLRTYEFVLDELLPTNRKPTLDEEAETDDFRKVIELKEISFSYPGGPTVLNSFSLNIERGQKIRVTGESGKGKSTLLLILAGLIKPSSGSISIDGKVRDIRLSRGMMGLVPQDPVLLNDSILKNIAFGVPEKLIDRQKVDRILDKLEMTDLIASYTDGVEHVVGEHGSKLSGGQRQRISIGRALYIDAKVLLLDEVTNQLDNNLESNLLSMIDKLAKDGLTIIMISHSPLDADFFDTICKIP
jgi:ATP-binding cassette, subfamily B, bacterial PglK